MRLDILKIKMKKRRRQPPFLIDADRFGSKGTCGGPDQNKARKALSIESIL